MAKFESSKYEIFQIEGTKKVAEKTDLRKCVIPLTEEDWVTLTNYGRKFAGCQSATSFINKLVKEWMDENKAALPALIALSEVD
jgi:hypothetical protein